VREALNSVEVPKTKRKLIKEKNERTK
jgi:hypothetical protein